MKHLKRFETFTKDYREFMIDNDYTYLRKLNTIRNNKLTDVEFEIKNYDIISKFSYFRKYNSYDVIIKADDHFNSLINSEFEFNFSINLHQLNEINLYDDLQKSLQGLSIGYKLYKMIVFNEDYISSNNALSKYAKNVWYNLICDDDFYSITSKKYSCVINKKTEKLKEIYEKILKNVYNFYNIKPEELILDKELKTKLTKIYGS